MPRLIQHGGPARRHHRGAVVVHDDRGAVEALGRRALLAQVVGGAMPLPVEVHLAHVGRLLCTGRRRLLGRSGDGWRNGSARGDRLDFDGLDDDGAIAMGIAVVLAMEGGEGRGHGGGIGEVRGMGRVRPRIAQLRPALVAHGLLLAGPCEQWSGCLSLEFLQRLLQLHEQLIVKRCLDRVLADLANVGKAHAVGRQHAGVGMDEDALQAEGVGHGTGVLTAGAAEAAQGEAADVEAALHREALDRARHVVYGDAQEAVRGVLW